MEILENLKIFSIPNWLKAVVVGLLAILGCLNTGLFFMGLMDHSREGWVKASLELMGVLLPVFLIGIVALGGNTGTASLQTRTEEALAKLLPEMLSRIADVPAPFRRIETGDKPSAFAWVLDLVGRSPGHKLPTRLEHHLAKVFVSLRRDECHADYVLLVPPVQTGGNWRELVFRVELNVRKVNLNICIDEEIARRRVNAPDDQPYSEFGKSIQNVLAHSLGGATNTSHEEHGHGGGPHEQHSKDHLVYSFNERAIQRTIDGRKMVCLVGAMWLADDFLWDASERLLFAQDLMFFLRAVTHEAGDMLREVPASELQHAMDRLTAPNAVVPA